MAGPWEAYAPAAAPSPVTDGPWASYAPPTDGGVTVEPGSEGKPTRVIMHMGGAKPKVTDGADRGGVDAGARGVAQGLTANFSDEMRGLVEASGANPDDPASLTALLHGALKYWTGDADAKKRYDEAVTRERGLNKTAEEQHPIASTVGNIAGAVALPLGAAANAATLPGRMAAGAVVGAGLGGAAGVGEGDGFVDSVSRGLTGVALGGAIGGAAPAVVEGAIRGGRALAQPITNTVRGIRGADDEAARRVALSIQRDMEIDPQAASRLTAGEFAASRQQGGPATIMDVGGETTRALARSAANTSPEGRAALNRTINDRFEGQGDRVTGWLRNTFHFPDAAAQSEALEQTARTVNRQRYGQAYRDGARPIWDGNLEQLTSSPEMQQAIRDATRTGATEAAITGGRPPQNPFQFAADGTMSPRAGVHPTLQFWDHVKRNLDSQIGVAQRSGDNPLVRQLTQLRGGLVNNLDTAVPSYAEARAGAAHFFGAQDALEAGQNFVGRNMGAGEARRALAQMTPTERQLFQDGFVSRFTETLNQTGDRRSILNKIAESPAARDKLNVALGRPRAQELEAGLRVEGIMDLARNAVQGNSTTARQLAELGLAGGTYGFSGGSTNPLSSPSALMNAALVYGAARGKNRINENVARRVAEMLTSNDPALLLRGIRVVTRNQNLFNSLRSVDRGLARVGGDQAPVAPALQAAGIARADDQQDVPRPPGQ